MTHAADATTAAEAMFAADEASRGLGIELVERGEGSAVLRMTVTPSMVNGHGIAHGGYVFLLADSAFACACNSHGPVTVAAGADITFVARRTRATSSRRGPRSAPGTAAAASTT